MINANLEFVTKDKTVTYIYGSLPVFSHDVDDLKTFRMISSQLYVNGSASQAEICRAFGGSRISVKRSVKLYREKGMAGFFEKPKCRGPAVLTPPVLEQIQLMLDAEHSIPEIARELSLKADTLGKQSLLLFTAGWVYSWPVVTGVAQEISLRQQINL